MTRRLLLLAFIFATFRPHPASSEDAPGFRVIVNSSNPITTVSRSTLAAMLLKSTTTWANGNKVMPVDLYVSSKTRDAMSRAIHGRSAHVIKNWWNQQIFAGKGVPPPELPSDARVVAYVSANSGAIGYVSLDTPLGDTKAVGLTE